MKEVIENSFNDWIEKYNRLEKEYRFLIKYFQIQCFDFEKKIKDLERKRRDLEKSLQIQRKISSDIIINLQKNIICLYKEADNLRMDLKSYHDINI